MKSALCERFGLDFPLFAFTHCRDVVAAVTNAGGFGVLGAMAHTPETLEIELKWLDEQVQGKPYGVGLVDHGGGGNHTDCKRENAGRRIAKRGKNASL